MQGQLVSALKPAVFARVVESHFAVAFAEQAPNLHEVVVARGTIVRPLPAARAALRAGTRLRLHRRADDRDLVQRGRRRGPRPPGFHGGLSSSARKRRRRGQAPRDHRRRGKLEQVIDHQRCQDQASAGTAPNISFAIGTPVASDLVGAKNSAATRSPRPRRRAGRAAPWRQTSRTAPRRRRARLRPCRRRAATTRRRSSSRRSVVDDREDQAAIDKTRRAVVARRPPGEPAPRQLSDRPAPPAAARLEDDRSAAGSHRRRRDTMRSTAVWQRRR